MKYYYGNDYKEALSNDPVEITSTKQLREYEECYNVVIPADDEEEEELEEEDNMKNNREADKELINKTFNVVRCGDGEDYDDDGYKVEYYSIVIKGYLDDELDEKLYNLDLKYYEGYDFNLDRGYYFVTPAKKGEVEVRFWKHVECDEEE